MRIKNPIFYIIILLGYLLLLIGMIITLIIFIAEGKSQNEEKTEKEDWSQYDCYILSIFWSPSSCFNKKENKEKCFDTIDNLDINKSFIIHGLWPTYSSGEYTDDCNKNEMINVTFDEEYKEYISKYWPGLYSSDNNLWNHEYNKHGYCYIKRINNDPEKDYKVYFDKTKEMFSQLNYNDLMENILPDTPQGIHKVSKERFQYILTNSKYKLDSSTYSLRCVENEENNTNMLSEIWFNYDMNFNRTSNVKISDNCPERFDIYFRDENRVPVWKKYDFYVMTVFWPISNCLEQGKECYKKFKEKELNIMTIHGLWPSFPNSIIPQWCNLDVNVEINNSTKEMEDYWINTYKKDNKDFWNHEYNKHGFCYNQRMNKSTDNYMIYFNKTLELYKIHNLKNIMKEVYPDLLPGMNQLNKTLLKEQLKKYIGNFTYAITCLTYQEQYYLYEIKFILDLNFSNNIKSDWKTGDDCPEIFYAELLDKPEGPKKQAETLYKEYDMYFFTILWQSTSCRKKGYQCYQRIQKLERNIFTMHGLWPNLRNGTIIQDYCNGPNDIEIEIKDKYLLEFMNEYYDGGYHSNEYFWGHEYNKHGYCYNKRNGYDVNNYELYFQKIKDMYIENNFGNLFLDFFKKEKIDVIPGDMAINRTKFEIYFNVRGISKDKYLIVCENITNEKNDTYPHISEMRIRYDLDFNLLKNETDKSEFDCPEIFYAEFLEEKK